MKASIMIGVCFVSGKITKDQLRSGYKSNRGFDVRRSRRHLSNLERVSQAGHRTRAHLGILEVSIERNGGSRGFLPWSELPARGPMRSLATPSTGVMTSFRCICLLCEVDSSANLTLKVLCFRPGTLSARSRPRVPGRFMFQTILVCCSLAEMSTPNYHSTSTPFELL